MDIQNKAAVFLGDSITEGAFVSKPENTFPRILKQLVGLKTIYNFGASGTRIARQTNPMQDEAAAGHFLLRVNKMPRADVVFVFGGTNDFGHGDAPFGNDNDTESDTFCGACRELFCALVNKYGKEKIVVMTPLKCVFGDNAYGDGRKLKPGRLLKDYAKQIKKCAESMDIKVIDLYNNSELDPCADGAKYFVDGLHPNDDGHRLLAYEIAEALNTL